MVHLNGELKSARRLGSGAIEFSYQSAARAIAILSRPPGRIEIDGAPAPVRMAGEMTILLPRGQHVITVEAP